MKVNGALGNIQCNLTGMITQHVRYACTSAWLSHRVWYNVIPTWDVPEADKDVNMQAGSLQKMLLGVAIVVTKLSHAEATTGEIGS